MTTPLKKLHVTGMTCQHCKQAVEDALLELDNQAQVVVDLDAGFVQVQTTATLDAICTALDDAGYSAVAA